MRSILAPRNRPVLDQFAFSNVVVAFDYDGTLAPIVDAPERAAMRPRTGQLLAALAELYPCIVISGRAESDTRSRLRGIRLRGVIGNHGVEAWKGVNGFEYEVRRWRPLLDRQLAGHPGVTLEDKTYSIAIHYRRSRAKRQARAAALRAASRLGAVRIVGGKQVVNVLPRNAPNKGDALERERERLSCDTAIYVGDDETDEDVFALDQPGRLLTIRVGAKRMSRADYCIRDQRQIDRLIASLAELRRRLRPSRARARG
jgi:trehalose 6-phosphate phosphatase